MRHVLVETNWAETNWVFDYAAPGHHKSLDAVALLNRARANDLQLHLPALCLTEARHVIMNKCQPRYEANAIRQFLARAKSEQTVSPDQERAAREVCTFSSGRSRRRSHRLTMSLRPFTRCPVLNYFLSTNDMLERAIDLAQSDLFLKPFDQARAKTKRHWPPINADERG